MHLFAFRWNNSSSKIKIIKIVTNTTLHKRWSFPLRISSVNVTKSAIFCSDTDESEHVDTKNLEWKLARKMLRVKVSFPKVSVEMS